MAFAYSRGNSIRIRSTFVASKDGYIGGQVALASGRPGAANREDPASIRKALLISALNLETTGAALPRQLSQLGILEEGELDLTKIEPTPRHRFSDST